MIKTKYGEQEESLKIERKEVEASESELDQLENKG